MANKTLKNALLGNDMSIPYWNNKADVLNLQQLNYEASADSEGKNLSVFSPSLASDSLPYADGVILSSSAKLD